MKYSVTPVMIFSSALLIFILPLARAQDVTLFLGGSVPGSISVDNVDTDLANGHIWGVRLSTGFIPFLGLEHTLGLSSDYLFPKNTSDIEDAKGVVYNSNAIATIPLGRFSPYGTIGIGFIRQYGSEKLPVGTKFAVNYGGGLKSPKLLGPFGLRFDARGYSVKNLNIFEISAGLLISW